MRIFATVEEIEAITALENAFLDSPSSNSAESKFASDQSRKELLTKSASLKPVHTLSELSSLVDKFPSLKEAQKRETFVSLSMALQKEKAKRELYTNEVGSSGRMEEAEKRAKKYQDLLKMIMPRDKPYQSLAQIQTKKANIDKIFDDATQ